MVSPQTVDTETRKARDMYQIIKQIYSDKINSATGLEMLVNNVPGYSKNSLRMARDIFLNMTEGRLYTYKHKTVIIVYFIEQLGVDYGPEMLENALNATYKHILYQYEQSGQKSGGLRNKCQEIAQKNNIDLSFDETMFSNTPPEENTDGVFVSTTPNPLPPANDSDTPEKSYDSYNEEDFLNEVYCIDRADYRKLTALLNMKKNLILQGAPGVGKTFAAKRLAYSIMGEKNDVRVMMIQFHQSYSYEDFIMGFRPSENGFKLQHGPFYSFCKTAREDEENSYFFIIDEINRGNLSNIFGELLTLLENDKRGSELRLLYSDEMFSIPSNVCVIGMMNTADRSIAMLDYALRRRFGFFDLEPAFHSEGFTAYQRGIANVKFDRLIREVESLNKDIASDESLGEGFRIGHSYFCKENIEVDTADTVDEWIWAIANFEIIPLIKEYWFDDPQKVEKWTAKLKEAVR